MKSAGCIVTTLYQNGYKVSIFGDGEIERLIGVEARCMWWIDEKLMHCNRGAPKILKTPYISCYFMYILSMTL